MTFFCDRLRQCFDRSAPEEDVLWEGPALNSQERQRNQRSLAIAHAVAAGVYTHCGNNLADLARVCNIDLVALESSPPANAADFAERLLNGAYVERRVSSPTRTSYTRQCDSLLLEFPPMAYAETSSATTSSYSESCRPENVSREAHDRTPSVLTASEVPNSQKSSFLCVDASDLHKDADMHEAEVTELEREQNLNLRQRRIPSDTLLNEMKQITNYADASNMLVVQGFNWESWRDGGGRWYDVVRSKLDTLALLGVTDVWLPPPSQSVAPQGYLPQQLFNLDGSTYGSQSSLEMLLTEMRKVGIRGVADIVINHRCGDGQDKEGRWNQFSTGAIDRESFVGVADWGGWAVTLGDKYSDGSGENYPGRFDAKFDAAPDIDHANERVQRSISIWLRWLRLQVGYSAWRFDFSKGYAAEYAKLYCDNSEPSWAVGELWLDMKYDGSGLCYNQDRHRQDTCNWINATGKRCAAFDFTTKGVLQEAVRNCQYWRLRDSRGKPPGLLGWMPEHAVTFLDNHDTGSTQMHWPFPKSHIMIGYAYILTHPGIPCLFWDHLFEWDEQIRKEIEQLVTARRKSAIPVDANVNIECADSDCYIAEIGNPPRLRVALGPRAVDTVDSYWSIGPGGKGYKVWVHE
eukprot:TRINITY_DN37464_c0_g1_i1.p1 TRINITY_DN37464_c0_g1~~TRINITY_DN37464_c0_g1_i1.p1  ORF type:complete len:648 (+),score=45.33 TRINITY_DN37464_c0_g1_i1:47-1945(+)